MSTPSARQIRADFDEETIVVYQAYRPAIALAALEAQTFVVPWSRERMTWIKPSFLWMMYRCGWTRKPGQEHALAVRIRREGFEWALSRAGLSSPGAAGVAAADWANYKRRYPCRVQWDPERSLRLGRLEHRSLQLGLVGEAVARYADAWITSIEDVTPRAQAIEALLAAGDEDAARALLPVERPYPLGPWAERLRATP